MTGLWGQNCDGSGLQPFVTPSSAKRSTWGAHHSSAATSVKRTDSGTGGSSPSRTRTSQTATVQRIIGSPRQSPPSAGLHSMPANTPRSSKARMAGSCTPPSEAVWALAAPSVAAAIVATTTAPPANRTRPVRATKPKAPASPPQDLNSLGALTASLLKPSSRLRLPRQQLQRWARAARLPVPPSLGTRETSKNLERCETECCHGSSRCRDVDRSIGAGCDWVLRQPRRTTPR